MKTIIQEYNEFKDDIDTIAKHLTEIHGIHIICKKGCASCCTNLTVWPIEYYSILYNMQQDNVQNIEPSDQSCTFLKNNECQIYTYRPIICRTHGLPITFQEDENSTTQQVTFCEKNFTTLTTPDFHSQNTLNIDKVNQILYTFHYRYYKYCLENTTSPPINLESRIPLTQLIQDLKNNISLTN
ncbi:MAG: YkgJ family cysteine cluster protein [Planctomycetes bacterium]|jgi:Fe-S-cluster containining protein|nr:YkgJ family cysteine cluster protein [Planctomycetota bacterium]HPY74446.1 YkgJ family cysteine cluster protein [Planctomycetota bacterium]HQA99997.1 YkgJ family cysteine cluster protein [Planctomycetota bacterium]